MKGNRFGRVVLGLIVLAVFAFFAYLHISVTPTSREIDEAGSPLDLRTKTGMFQGVGLPAVAAQPGEPGAPDEEPSDQVPAEEPTPSPTPEPTPEPTVDPNSPEGRAMAKGLPAPPDIDINSWEFVLVNSTHNVGADFAPPEVANVSSSRCPQDSRIADALMSFANGCSDAGLPVYLSSGYRSYNEQSQTYNAKVAQVGAEQAKAIVAPPGTSEHQTGLCCDITDVYRNPKVPSVLSQTETFKWLNEHCAEYGFILRYPDGKGDITGIIYEPWHFRYVGTEAAEYIQANDITFEEFVALYTGEEVPGA